MYASPSIPLSAEAIVSAGIDVLESDGLEALTMRRLAKQLGASPMSLYRHVATKEELLRLIADRQLAEVELPDTEGLPWRTAIVELTSALHRSFLAHPHLSAILAVQHIDAVAIFRATEVILRALRSAGLDDREAVRALDVITSYAAGFTQRRNELRSRTAAPGERLDRLHNLPPELPTVAELAGQIVALDFDHRFEEGLALILDGIEFRLARG
jgi:AcrR family transcriptional regulator